MVTKLFKDSVHEGKQLQSYMKPCLNMDCRSHKDLQDLMGRQYIFEKCPTQIHIMGGLQLVVSD